VRQYVSTGLYVSICDHPSSPPVTGVAVFTGYISQSHSDSMAYNMAVNLASGLRLLSPCLPYSATPPVIPVTPVTPYYLPTFPTSKPWTNTFKSSSSYYFDIATFGSYNHIYSGDRFGDRYFVDIAASDLSNDPIVLGVMSDGTVTGYGKNQFNLLDFPVLPSTPRSISLGYDHCLVTMSDNTIAGWGRDAFGALSVVSANRNDIFKAIALNGGSLILTTGGIISGTANIQNSSSNIPFGRTGAVDIDGYNTNGCILFNDGTISGVGYTYSDLLSPRTISNISGLSAGKQSNLFIYNELVSGYGSNLAEYVNGARFAAKAKLISEFGLSLNKSGNLYSWGNDAEVRNAEQFSSLYNNVVDISSAETFGAALFKRNFSYYVSNYTGSNYAWLLSGVENYHNGKLVAGNIYPDSGKVIQDCDSTWFYLPKITQENESYIRYVSECSVAKDIPFTYKATFQSKKRFPLLNINYWHSNQVFSGVAATGITNGDYWNHLNYDAFSAPLRFSDGNVSYITGGHILDGYGVSELVSNTYPNNLAKTAIHQTSGFLHIPFYNIPSGIYNIYCYGRGSGVDQNSMMTLYRYGYAAKTLSTSTGEPWPTNKWVNNQQYVLFTGVELPYKFNYIAIGVSGYINGIQIYNLTPFISDSGIFDLTAITGIGIADEDGLPILDEDGNIIIGEL
jgi:hypothetical protein